MSFECSIGMTVCSNRGSDECSGSQESEWEQLGERFPAGGALSVPAVVSDGRGEGGHWSGIPGDPLLLVTAFHLMTAFHYVCDQNDGPVAC